MSVLAMAVELNGKRVLIREDLNVPIKDGKELLTLVCVRRCRPLSWRWKRCRGHADVTPGATDRRTI